MDQPPFFGYVTIKILLTVFLLTFRVILIVIFCHILWHSFLLLHGHLGLLLTVFNILLTFRIFIDIFRMVELPPSLLRCRSLCCTLCPGLLLFLLVFFFLAAILSCPTFGVFLILIFTIILALILSLGHLLGLLMTCSPSFSLSESSSTL